MLGVEAQRVSPLARHRIPVRQAPSRQFILQLGKDTTQKLGCISSLQRLEDRDLYTEVCARLKATTRDTFSQHGWPHSLRIGAAS
jgi:hypothetical protein